MTHPISSTYIILKMKAFNEDIDESWIDWAVDMIEAGYESDNLYMLAGYTRPYNQFELQELAEKVLQDMNLDYADKEAAIRNYARFIIQNAIGVPITYFSTLEELKDIYYKIDTAYEYQDFMKLYYAKEERLASPDQWYWNDATRENIDGIIRERFQQFLDDFDARK